MLRPRIAPGAPFQASCSCASFLFSITCSFRNAIQTGIGGPFACVSVQLHWGVRDNGTLMASDDGNDYLCWRRYLLNIQEQDACCSCSRVRNTEDVSPSPPPLFLTPLVLFSRRFSNSSRRNSSENPLGTKGKRNP
ncbi:hypothetical protein NPIL_540281 [Nephila pilipes]|uniref:Uncharacterized protein n=1 Tax=Nephila pilipes TaxID=299642 RepID=A0A8X6TA17_NEPPI|nr:hypothetical protein NPIL_540281 [Nephila pilipes]